MNNSEYSSLLWEIRKAIDALASARDYAVGERAVTSRLAKAEKLAREALIKAERTMPRERVDY